jgi:hypothetical protein
MGNGRFSLPIKNGRNKLQGLEGWRMTDFDAGPEQ